MEIGGHCCAAERSRKRKAREEKEDEGSRFPLDQLNQDVLEQVLSWLPTSNFYRVTPVCKRWKSVLDSATFHRACSQIPSRDPWYFMVDTQSLFNNQPIVFDPAENNWKKLNFSPHLQQNQGCDFVPVAASGGLICFRSAAKEFIVCNPVTGTSHQLISLNCDSQQSKILRAIAIISSSESYKLVLVYGESSELSFRVYNSKTKRWEEEIRMSRKLDGPAEPGASEDENAMYFLSKCGNVVSTDLQRSPCKQYSSVITQKNGEEIMYFLSSSGRIIACNLTSKCYFEYPRLFHVYHEYSIDLIECGGEVFVVVLSEFLESASLRVWRFDEKTKSWVQIAAMPPAMSHEFYGKKVDINCTGAGKQILVCLNSAEICSYFLCNLVNIEWTELPNCYVNGKAKEFSCAFSFEPRIEAPYFFPHLLSSSTRKFDTVSPTQIHPYNCPNIFNRNCKAERPISEIFIFDKNFNTQKILVIEIDRQIDLDLEKKLLELQKQLSKKHLFEEAVASIRSLLQQFYPSASPSLQQLFYFVVCRVATILKTRYTAPGFWNAGLVLFLEAECLVFGTSERKHLQNCIAQAREHLGEMENQSEDSESAQPSRNRGFLFEGHLTVDPAPPQPDWLVQSNMLTAAATLLASESSHEGEGNSSTSEDAANVLRELVNRLDDMVPMFLDSAPVAPRVPPASKEVVAKLPVTTVTEENLTKFGANAHCAICLENLAVNDKMQELPCKHMFHSLCLKPWLDEHNSCPICRHELQTDDHAYESWKEREKEAEEERKRAANAVRGGEYMYV